MSENDSVQISEDELKEFRKLTTTFDSYKDGISGIELQMKRLRDSKESMLEKMDITESNLKMLEASIIKKYGNGKNIRVDLSTGKVIFQ